MSDKKIARPDEEKGGYPSGDKLVSDLPPPPKGPGAGAKPASGSGQGSGKQK